MLQKPLDSYQEEGLSRVREEWSERVRVVKERLDAAIHKVAESDDSSELEASLLGR